MFTLLYGFWKHVFKKDDYFVLILGLDNAGKTVCALNLFSINLAIICFDSSSFKIITSLVVIEILLPQQGMRILMQLLNKIFFSL